MALELLDNIPWHSLVGPQAGCAAGAGDVRRYARGFSPIVGLRDPAKPDFAALAACCEPGEAVYVTAWDGAEPTGWEVRSDSRIDQYAWDAPAPPVEPVPGERRLGPADVPQMLALVALTQPGPFGERTIELGDYHGVFGDGQLLAMCGERMAAGRLREVSGVCTHPDARGRGLARGLIARVVRDQLQRGEIPFLHVMHDNAGARRLYEAMGFRHHRRLPVRVIARRAG